jgi:3-hydroxyisobutyrate dehydrogenase-like beta-hydroxyacid dehydrogenase
VQCAPLVELGATVADTPAAVGAASDVVISMVGYPSDVRTVLLGDGGEEGGALSVRAEQEQARVAAGTGRREGWEAESRRRCGRAASWWT